MDTELPPSPRTVRRDWTKARLWLYDDLHGGVPDSIEPSTGTQLQGLRS